MTNDEKDLLLKDLCARLPYGIKVAKSNIIYPITGVNIALGYVELAVSERISIKEAVPYLRPMSSITEKEKQERYKFSAFNNIEVFDWYNAHHFDYRGLIPMGLALPAPEEMYK